ncbi:MAG: hypothetical protein ACLFTH_01095 [Candidatus Woesearchaeota archaeon]
MVQTTLVYQGVSLSALDSLPAHGFLEQEIKSDYERYRLKKGKTTLVLYSSGKLVVSVPENKASSLDMLLSGQLGLRLKSSEKSARKTSEKTLASPSSLIPDAKCLIGSDETLKGDTFGGLIVCACLLCDDDEPSFRELGVRDSKLLSENEIRRVATSLLDKYPDSFTCIELLPEEYNAELSGEPRSTKLLDKLHESVTSELHKSPGGKDVPVIVDKYPGCSVGDVILERAESHCTAVAAASIVARFHGVKQFDRLSVLAGFKLPFGSTHVKDALQELKRKGLPPQKFCKLHFSNVKKEFGM